MVRLVVRHLRTPDAVPVHGTADKGPSAGHKHTHHITRGTKLRTNCGTNDTNQSTNQDACTHHVTHILD